MGEPPSAGVSSPSIWYSELPSTRFEADVEVPLFVSPASLALSKDQFVIADNLRIQQNDTVARDAESLTDRGKKPCLPMLKTVKQFGRTRKKNPDRGYGPNPWGRAGRLRCKRCRDWRRQVTLSNYTRLYRSASSMRTISTSRANCVESEASTVRTTTKFWRLHGGKVHTQSQLRLPNLFSLPLRFLENLPCQTTSSSSMSRQTHGIRTIM